MGDDNIVYVDFSKKDKIDQLVEEKLDEKNITDSELRQGVHDRAEKWRSWLERGIMVKTENISVTLDELPEHVREEARPEIQEWMAEQIAAWFKQTGIDFVSEVLALAIGQAKLEQRARDQDMTLL